jgi:hypothetical protein
VLWRQVTLRSDARWPANLIGIALVGVALALPGCKAAGPSDSTVEAALRDRISGPSSGRSERVTVNSVKVLRCIRAGDDAHFNCSFEIYLDIERAGRVHATGDIDMLKVANGWTYDVRRPLSMSGR